MPRVAQEVICITKVNASHADVASALIDDAGVMRLRFNVSCVQAPTISKYYEIWAHDRTYFGSYQSLLPAQRTVDTLGSDCVCARQLRSIGLGDDQSRPLGST